MKNMEQLQIEPNPRLTPSPKKVNRQDQDIPQQRGENIKSLVNQFPKKDKLEPTANELDVTQMSFKIVEIPQQIQQGMPQNKQKISLKDALIQGTLKISWGFISCLMIISILLISGISAGVCYGMIKYSFITISPIENSLKNEGLARVGDQAPTENTPQSITSNSFCGTINLKIQNGMTISNGGSTQNQPSVQDGWVYFDQPKQIYSFSFNNLNENVINFESVLPKNIRAKYIKLIIWNNAGYTNEDYYRYNIRTRVVNGNKQWAHWTVGCRWKHVSYTFNSESVIVPCSQTREVRFQSWRTQENGWLVYLIAGYLPATP